MAVEEQEELTGKEQDEALTETLTKTLRDIQARPAEDEPVPATEAVAPASEAVEAKAPKDERARDEHGKFIEKPKESAAPAKANTLETPTAAVAPAQAAAEAPLVTTTGQPIDINRAPSSWKPAAKAVWPSLPEPVRQEIYRRESDFLLGGKGLKENADFGQRMKTAMEPYRFIFETEGRAPEDVISNYVRTAAIFRTGTREQKLATLFDIDKQFSAGLNEHFQNTVRSEVMRITGQGGQPQQHQAQPPVYQDPRVDQLMASLQKQEQERKSNEERVANAATEKFFSAKDDKGLPLYPYVDNVLDDMSARVENLRRTNPALGHEEILKQAYEAASWANPEVRAVLISNQQAVAQQPAETLRKVEQAKRASAGNMPKRGALPQTKSAAKWGTPEADQEMLDTLRQLTG